MDQTQEHNISPFAFPSCMSGVVISRTYKLLELLAEGSCCAVYKARDLRNGYEYAAKIECFGQPPPYLEDEYNIYRFLHNHEDISGIPSVYHFEKRSTHSVLIMQRFGRAVHNPSLVNHALIPIHIVASIGMDILKILVKVHKRGVVHLDISPANIVANSESNATPARLVDFGRAEHFMNVRTGRHRSYTTDTSANGPISFSSIRTHLQLRRSRVDDLESLGYSLISMHRGVLPWDDYLARESASNALLVPLFEPGSVFGRTAFRHVGNMKREIGVQQLCEGMPLAFESYFCYVRAMDCNTKPDYKYLIGLFRSCLAG